MCTTSSDYLQRVDIPEDLLPAHSARQDYLQRVDIPEDLLPAHSARQDYWQRVDIPEDLLPAHSARHSVQSRQCASVYSGLEGSNSWERWFSVVHNNCRNANITVPPSRRLLAPEELRSTYLNYHDHWHVVFGLVLWFGSSWS